MFLGSHGASRFQKLSHESRRSESSEDDTQIVRDRVGFRRGNADGETEFLIFIDAFRAEVCAGYDHHAVAKELGKRGFLVREPPNMTIKPRLHGMRSIRVYAVRAAILEGEEC